jgi:hypothetical protein
MDGVETTLKSLWDDPTTLVWPGVAELTPNHN